MTPAIAVECQTSGQSVLAQKMLFEKGYGWGASREKEVKNPGRGQYIIMRPDECLLTYLELGQWKDYYATITLSEIASWPKEG